MNVVKITVLKRAVHSDLAQAIRGAEAHPCEFLSEGQVFYASATVMPDGFCGWAWQDISRVMVALQTGGSFDRGFFRGWMREDNTAVSCCTDGFRPVSFKLERLDVRTLIDISGLDHPAPKEVYESERWGEFSYSVPGLAPGARHRVRLHFCEVYHQGPGKRRFHVQAGGKRVIEDLDIFAQAGGAYRPVVRELELAADSSGTLVLSFVRGAIDQPKLSALEILPASAGPAASPLHAINAGGGDLGSFQADRFFAGGNAVSG